MRFKLPGAPCAQGRPRFTARGGKIRAYDPAKSRAYKARTALVAKAAAEKAGWELNTESPVSVKISVVMAIPKSFSRVKRQQALEGLIRPAKKPDLDNIYKCVTDALSGVIYKDDRQIVKAEMEKRYGEEDEAGVYVEAALEQCFWGTRAVADPRVKARSFIPP